MEFFWNQLSCFYLQLCHFLFLISNLPFFYYFSHLYPTFFLWFPLFLLLLCLFFSLLSSFFFFFLLPSTFAILTSPALVSTAFYILLDTSSFLLFLFSSQSQDYDIQVMAFPRSHSTFVPQSHQFPFSLCTLGNRY